MEMEIVSAHIVNDANNQTQFVISRCGAASRRREGLLLSGSVHNPLRIRYSYGNEDYKTLAIVMSITTLTPRGPLYPK